MQKIGFIDWTEDKINFYIFERKDSKNTLVDTRSISIHGELDQSLILTPLLNTDIEYVYLSVPINLLSIRELSLPFLDRTKINDVVPYELDGLLLGDITDYSIDHIILGTSDNKSSVLTASMDKKKLSSIIDLFSSAGLEPAVITSIDLRFVSRNPDILFESHSFDEKLRSEAAREEILEPSINLRQRELAYKGDIERMKKSLRFTGVLVLLLILALGSSIVIKFTTLKKEHTLLAKETTAIYRETFPEETKIVDAVRQFKGNFNLLRDKKTVLGGLPVLDILLNIAQVKDNEIMLNEFTIAEGNIIIKGSAASFENVDSFKNTLSSSFDEIKVIDSKASPDKKISFSITMKEKLL